MSCQEHDCQDKISFLCQECPEFQNFCIDHEISHSNIPFNHSIKCIDDKEIDDIQEELLHKKIDYKLALILDKSIKVIKAFKAIAQQKISRIENNRSFSNQEDYFFNIKECLSILISADLIKQGTFVLEDEIAQNELIEKELNLSIKKLSTEFHNKSEEVENLKKERDARLREITEKEKKESDIRERDIREKKLAIHRGKNSQKFKSFPLEKKKEIAETNWPFVDIFDNIKDMLLSKDGKFLFTCKFKIGKFEADFCNLHGRL